MSCIHIPMQQCGKSPPSPPYACPHVERPGLLSSALALQQSDAQSLKPANPRPHGHGYCSHAWAGPAGEAGAGLIYGLPAAVVRPLPPPSPHTPAMTCIHLARRPAASADASESICYLLTCLGWPSWQGWGCSHPRCSRIGGAAS